MDGSGGVRSLREAAGSAMTWNGDPIMKHLPRIALATLLLLPLAGTAAADDHGHGPVRAVLTAEAQQALTPDEALAHLKQGNAHFVAGKSTSYDWLAQAEATAKAGQYPRAAVLSCVDSRVPVEVIFDQGIGDVFVGRVAGNFENVDLLGSLEFATAASGVPLIVVLGHSDCGAVKGALQGVEMGNLTAMLENLDEAVAEAKAAVKGDPLDPAVVAAAVEANVRDTVADILERSEVIAGQVEKGEVKVVGAVYDLATGEVAWLSNHEMP
jgi:carbonic anhydrase